MSLYEAGWPGGEMNVVVRSVEKCLPWLAGCRESRVHWAVAPIYPTPYFKSLMNQSLYTTRYFLCMLSRRITPVKHSTLNVLITFIAHILIIFEIGAHTVILCEISHCIGSCGYLPPAVSAVIYIQPICIYIDIQMFVVYVISRTHYSCHGLPVST